MRPAEMPLAFGIQKSGVGKVIGRGNEIFQQRPQFGSFYMLGADVSAACDLKGRGQDWPASCAASFLALGNVVGQRAGDGILQQHLVGVEAIAINRLHLRRVEIHRDDADRDQHAEDDVQDWYARRNGQLQ